MRRQGNRLVHAVGLSFCRILIVLSLACLIPADFARGSKPSAAPPTLVPAAFLKWPEKGPEYAVLVDKSTQRVFLYRKADPHRPFRVYRASTGENDGPKTRLNDKKTPEGIYFFTEHITDRFLAPRYGVMAFPIDYPNPVDKKDGKNGYGIWFHGLNKPLKPRDTNGCIALNNRDIEDLARFITLHETPIVISPKLRMMDLRTLKEEAEFFERLITRWRQDWEEKDIRGYMSHYSRSFHSGWKGWYQWKEYKERVARKYARISVAIDNLWILRNDGIVVASFDQYYSGGTFKSYGRKKLYFQKNSLEWKIVSEDFRPLPLKRAALRWKRSFDPAEVKEFITSWKEAWESKDLTAYLSHYDKTFRSGKMDIEAWKGHKGKLNHKYRRIRVSIRDLRVVKVSEQKALASFKQVYEADTYKDYGLKKISLIKRGDRWKITREEWQRVTR